MVESESLKYKNDEELRDLYTRAMGNSTRIVDELVQKFFNEPQGTIIPVVDHYSSRQADEFLFRRLAERIEQEHHAKFHREWLRNGICIVRDDPTLQELVKKELDRRTGIDNPPPPKESLKYKLRYR